MNRAKSGTTVVAAVGITVAADLHVEGAHITGHWSLPLCFPT